MNEKQEKKDAIAVFVPDLDSTPGWSAMSQDRKDRILDHTSKARQFYGMGIVSDIGECFHLLAIEEELSFPGSPMSMKAYLKNIYGPSERSGYSSKKIFARWQKNWPRVIDFVQKHPEDAGRIFRKMGKTQMGTYAAISENIPEPKVINAETVENLLTNQALPAMSAIKRNARKGVKQKKDRTQAQFECFRIIHANGQRVGLKTSADFRSFLTPIFGWAMEAFAVHGTMRVGRVSVPDGAYAKVGRPRDTPEVRKAKRLARQKKAA